MVNGKHIYIYMVSKKTTCSWLTMANKWESLVMASNRS